MAASAAHGLVADVGECVRVCLGMGGGEGGARQYQMK